MRYSEVLTVDFRLFWLKLRSYLSWSSCLWWKAVDSDERGRHESHYLYKTNWSQLIVSSFLIWMPPFPSFEIITTSMSKWLNYVPIYSPPIILFSCFWLYINDRLCINAILSLMWVIVKKKKSLGLKSFLLLSF